MKKLIPTALLTCVLASPAVAEDDMRALTNGILASLNGSSPETASSARGTGADALQSIIQQALSEGQSDDYLQALLSEAEADGQIEVSDAMRTTEGRIDAHVLLAALAAKSGGLGSDYDISALEAEATASTRVAEVVSAERFYTVKSGDSLAAIALAHYDSAQAYTTIFEANRDTLSSPDRIQVGQVLLLP